MSKINFILLVGYYFIFKLVTGHEDAIDSKDFESSDVENPSRRNDVLSRQWQYEGLPIDVEPHRRRVELQEKIYQKLAPTKSTTTQSTTTPTTTTRAPSTRPDFRFRRVFNPDETTSTKDYPFMAALQIGDKLWCGGAVIGQDKIITAANCLQLQYNNRFFREYVKMLTVRLGSSNATAGGETYRVTEIFFHPNYKPQTLEFNVAVIRLHKNVTFGREPALIDQILIYEGKTVPVDKTVTFLGWGAAYMSDGLGGETLLQKVDLPVYDTSDCQEVYGKDLVSNTNFCAGFISKTKNVCNHDAGGPAVMDGRLVGILSFSNKRCDQTDKPAVFTNLGALADWIHDIEFEKLAAAYRP